MKLLINSYKNNQIALDVLLDSLKAIPEFLNIECIVCVGGFTDDEGYTISSDNNISYIKCNHNSIDYTAFVTVAENQETSLFNEEDHYFYMHDTCKAGPQFIENINKIDTTNMLGKPLLGKHSKNIGVYSNEIIMKHKYFLTAKTKNTDDSQAMKYKDLGYRWEDAIFRMHGGRQKMPGCLIRDDDQPGKIEVSKPVDYYGTGNLRIVSYYPAMDLYKIQANAGNRTGLPPRGTGCSEESQLNL